MAGHLIIWCMGRLGGRDPGRAPVDAAKPFDFLMFGGTASNESEHATWRVPTPLETKERNFKMPVPRAFLKLRATKHILDPESYDFMKQLLNELTLD